MTIKKLAQYETQRSLSRTSFGQRFEAIDQLSGHPVLLTRLPRQLIDLPSFEKRLLATTKQAAQLRHDGLQRLYGVQRDGETLYLVGEQVPGHPLAARRGKALPLTTALSLAARVAMALDALHRAQMVHGALTPPAVFVARAYGPNGVASPRITLSDLGLPALSARELAEVRGLVRSLVPYLAPEQALKGRATPSSDIFSLGVLLYEWVTGELPFDPQRLGNGLASFYRQPVRRADEARPDIPPQVAALIHEALALRPTDRFPGAGQMAQALQALVIDAPVARNGTGKTNGVVKTAGSDGEQEQRKPASPLVVSVTPTILEMTPGKQTVVNVTIRNLGEDVDHATLNIEDLPRQWISMSQEFVRLVPGTEALLPVTISVPREHSATAGRLSFKIVVASTAHDDFVASVPGTLVIHPFSKLRVDASPLALEHGGRVTVAVRNEGNATETFSVEGGNLDGTVAVTGEQNRLRLLPGATGTVSMQVVANSQPTFGESLVLPFSIRVSARSGVESEHSGQLQVPPAIPRWLAMVLAVLLLLATTAGAIQMISSIAPAERPTPLAVAAATATQAMRMVEENEGYQEGDATGAAVETRVSEEGEGGKRATAEAPETSEEGDDEGNVAASGTNEDAQQEVVEQEVTPLATNDGEAEPIATVAIGPFEENDAVEEAVTYIAYQRDSGEAGSEIRLVANDGSGDRLLVENGTQPAWAPDGRRLAFVRSHYDSEGSERIYRGDVLNLVTLNGTLLAPLSEGVRHIGGVAWSPDGRQVAYHAVPAGRDDGTFELFVAQSDGSGVRQITVSEGGASSLRPAWSRGGEQLLFVRQQPLLSAGQETASGLYLIDVAGGEGSVQSVFVDQSLPVVSSGHSWSPDGTRILFTVSAPEGERFFISEADGSSLVQLPGMAVQDGVAYWSPDGSQILYRTESVGEPAAVLIVSVDGLQWEQVTEGVAVADARWSADGRHIALVANREDDALWELYQIAVQPSPEGELVWEPLPVEPGELRWLAWQPQ